MVKVKITEPCCKGLAIGYDDLTYTKYFVHHGDLFLGKVTEVDITDPGKGIVKQFNYNFSELVSYHDSDGLISINQLKESDVSSSYDRVFEIEGYWLTPRKKITNVVEILLNDSSLRGEAKIKLCAGSDRGVISSGLPIFGVSFQKTIEKVITDNISKAHFYCPDKKEHSNSGIFADFFIIAEKERGGTPIINLHFWQALGEDEITFYAHGIVDYNNKIFTHFDCALHKVSVEKLSELFNNHNKVDIQSKEKFFRVDGNIEYEKVFSLMKAFFPMDYLVDEYYVQD